MSRERKTYAWILAVVVSALLVDQLILSGGSRGPDPVGADMIVHQGGSDTPPPTPAQVESDSVKCGSSIEKRPVVFADRLKATCPNCAGDASGVRDIFQPGVAWLSELSESVPEVPEDPVERFKRCNQLNAVLLGVDGMAIVNENCLRVGQTVDGFILVAVRGGAAEFRRGPHRVELTLP